MAEKTQATVQAAVRFARRVAAAPGPDDPVVRLKSHARGSREFEAAATDLYERYGRLVWLVCARELAWRGDCGPDDGPELIRDARSLSFTQLLADPRRVTDADHARNWWKRAARHRLRDLLRKSKRRLARNPDVDPNTFPQQPADERADEELLLALDAALDELRPEVARAIRLCKLDGLSEAEAAARLGVPEGTVSSRLKRGLGKLQAKLARHRHALSVGAIVALFPRLATASRLPRAEAAAQVRLALEQLVTGAAGGAAGAWWLTAAAAALLSGGLAVGGWEAMQPAPEQQPTAQMAEPPRTTTAPPNRVTAPAEPVPARHERLFRERVLPQQLAALGPLALGGGTVELVRAGAFDTRFEAEYRLRHNLPTAPGWTSRLWLINDADSGRCHLLFDPRETGRYDVVRTDRSGRPSLTLSPGSRDLLPLALAVPVGPLAEARDAFAAFPRDQAVRDEARAARDRMTAALAPYLGDWARNGDRRRRCQVKMNDGYPIVVLADGSFWGDGDGHLFFRIGPDGRPAGLHVFGGPMRFSPDRIELANEFWTRVPEK